MNIQKEYSTDEKANKIKKTTTMIYAEVSEENTKNDHKKYIV